MSKSTTTHEAALKALANLLEVTLALELRIGTLGESGVFDYDDGGEGMRDLCERAATVMGRAQKVLDDTKAVTPEAAYLAAKQAKARAKEALRRHRAGK